MAHYEIKAKANGCVHKHTIQKPNRDEAIERMQGAHPGCEIISVEELKGREMRGGQWVTKGDRG